MSGVQVALASILVLDIVWFLARPTWLSKIVGIVFIYALLFVAMVSTYLFPVTINQDVGFTQTLKNAALLTLANPFYSLAVALFQVGSGCSVSKVCAACVLHGISGLYLSLGIELQSFS